MAHALSIQTKEFPWEMDMCDVKRVRLNGNGKQIFTMKCDEATRFEGVGMETRASTQYSISVCRLHTVSAQTDVFDGVIILGGKTATFVDYYVINDQMIGIVFFDRTHHLLHQYMMELVSPKILSTAVHPTIQSIRRDRGHVLTVCIRRIKLGRVNGSATVGLGMVHNGTLFVSGQYWQTINGRDTCTLVSYLIASNPLQIDQYPNMEITEQISELSHITDSQRLWLLPYGQMITSDRVYFLLITAPTRLVPTGTLVTDRLGVVHLQSEGFGKKKRSELITVDNTAIVCPEEITRGRIKVTSQTGDMGFYEVEVTDREKVPSLISRLSKGVERWIDICYGLTQSLSNWSDRYDDGFGLRIASQIVNPTLDQIKHDLVLPKRRFIYALDLKNLQFKKITHEWKRNANSRRQTFEASPNGAFASVKLPCKHTIDGKEQEKNVVVTMSWIPGSVPSLKEIAERVVLKYFPVYKSSKIRRNYGLMNYGESESDHRPVSIFNRFSNVDYSMGLSIVGDAVELPQGERNRMYTLMNDDVDDDDD